MEEKIIELFEKINNIGFYCVYYKKSDYYVEKAKELLPDISAFTEWFLSENIFGIEEEIYLMMQQDILEILHDCMEALKENDNVLMLDALENGLGKLLKQFIPDEYFIKKGIVKNDVR